jgi:hypothetical protein
VDGYREFWNRVFYGDPTFVGTFDIQTYWLRLALIVAVFFVAGLAASRLRWLPIAMTTFLVAVYVVSVAPFMIWSARCAGCGASFSYDTARSYEAMLVNQWWGGLIGMAIAAMWMGATTTRIWRSPQ